MRLPVAHESPTVLVTKRREVSPTGFKRVASIAGTAGLACPVDDNGPSRSKVTGSHCSHDAVHRHRVWKRLAAVRGDPLHTSKLERQKAWRGIGGACLRFLRWADRQHEHDAHDRKNMPYGRRS